MVEKIIVKKAEADLSSKQILGLGLPLAALGLPVAMNATMANSMAKVPNPHVKGGPDTWMYQPTLEATNRVRAGKGNMLDHMRAYKHPNQIQNHPLYGPINKLGPGLMSGLSNASNFMWGRGMGQGALSGGLAGAGTGLLGNAILKLFGRSEMPAWKAMLIGGGLGAGVGAGGAKYRDWRTTQLNKTAAWRSPGMDVGRAQSDIQSVLSMLRSAPGLSFNQRAQLMSAVGQLDPASAAQLRSMLSVGGGSATGAIIARFLMGKGLVPQVLGALLGGVIGHAVFGKSGPRTASGNPGLVGVDLSGRRFDF